MRYFILHHQHKGREIDRALLSVGWQRRREPEIALFDTDHNKKLVDMFPKATAVLYPHTASPMWWYDSGLMEIHPAIKALLVIGDGQAEVQKIITPHKRVEKIGWSYCPIMSFRNVEKVRRIVFAPMHPNGGRLRPEAKQTNASVFRELLKLKDVQIVVRMIGSLKDNGLWHDAKVIWKSANPDGSYAEIDMADLVIGEGMYLSLAVARGKPAIGMNQHVPIRGNAVNAKTPPHWELFGEKMAFPVDFADGAIMELIDRAMDESVTADWKKRFIGEPLVPKTLANILIDIREESLK